MKLVVQRVKNARVTRISDKKVVGRIDSGLFILVGFKIGDSEKVVEQLALKISKLRVMSDSLDKMNLSVTDANGKLLVVSQFTLYANTKDGNRPSFIEAEVPEKAVKLYNHFIEKLKSLGMEVETGSFGDYMEISTALDGPVTIIYDTSNNV